MPIYEFYCPDCHAVFSFFSATVDTEARPACPECGRPELGRRPSRFATVRAGRPGGEGEAGGEGGEGNELFAGMDEQRMERAMEQLAGEMGELGGLGGPDGSGDAEPDPRQIARFMRRFGEVAGLEPGPKLQEMIRKLESGADPDSLEEEFPDEGGDENEAFAELFQVKKSGGKPSRRGRPRVDETLHFL